MNPDKTFILGSPVLTASLFLTLGVTLTILLSPASPKLPGEAVSVIPAQKIEPGAKHPSYNSNPPSSGWYTDGDFRDGIYQQELKDEQIVKAIYSGKVVINYDCQYKSILPTSYPREILPDQFASSAAEDSTGKKQTPQEALKVWENVNKFNQTCGDLIAQLRKIMDEKGTKDLILAPRPKLETRLSLVAWGRQAKMMFLDREEIVKFIDAYRGLNNFD